MTGSHEQARARSDSSDRPTGVSRRSGLIVGMFFALVLLAAITSLVHLPYAVFRPGPAFNTLGSIAGGKPVIQVSGTTYPTTGALDFTTVSVYGGPSHPVNVWDVLRAKLERSAHIYPEREIFPAGQSGKQVEKENTAEMVDSQQEAVAAALRATGRTVPEVISVAQVAAKAPSAGVLRVGDTITAVDGSPVADSAALRSAIQRHSGTAPLLLSIIRGGTALQVRSPTAVVSGRKVLGVSPRISFQFPVKVTINAGDVGGPSAGLMFSLGIYDKLTPGALTGGARVGGTGTIDSRGNVGPIGGIQQKLYGAYNAGARWFLAPAANCTEVVGHIPRGLHVVRVATFDEARTSVQAIAARRTGDLAECTSNAPTAAG